MAVKDYFSDTRRAQAAPLSPSPRFPGGLAEAGGEGQGSSLRLHCSRGGRWSQGLGRVAQPAPSSAVMASELLVPPMPWGWSHSLGSTSS